jgi:superfamily II DNA or RNA helicase
MARTPPKDSPPPRYVNWRGEAVDPRTLKRIALPNDAPKATPKAMAKPPAAAQAIDLVATDHEAVFDALCLAGCERSKVWLTNFMNHLERRTSSGADFSVAAVGASLAALQAQRRVLLQPSGRHDVPTELRNAQWPRLLTAPDIGLAWRAWARASSPGNPSHNDPLMPDYRSPAEMQAIARLALAGKLGIADWRRVMARVLGPAGNTNVLAAAMNMPFVAEAFEGMNPELREGLLIAFQHSYNLDTPPWQPMLQWLDAQLARAAPSVSPGLRFLLAERRLHRGDIAGSEAALQDLGGAGLGLMRAAALAWAGRWVDASAAFSKAYKETAKETGVKRGFTPERLLQWYVLSLLAQPDPAAWTAARKLCVQESGSRQPDPHEAWGLWAHAAAVRLGDTPLAPGVLDAPPPNRRPAVLEDDAHRLILAAWLGEPSKGWSPSMLGALVQLLHETGVPWKADLVRQACDRLDLRLAARTPAEGEPWPVAYFGAKQEAWRDALAAIEALGDLRGKDSTAAAAPVTLQWHVTLDSAGRVTAVQPWERSPGVRGPGKPKPATLARVKKATRLDPRDAAVARAIEPQRWSPGLLGMDVTAAAMALVGHPAVFFDDAPEQVVDLREALPVLEVLRQPGTAGAKGDEGDEGERYVFKLLDPLLSTVPPAVGDNFTATDPSAEAERRNGIRIVRDAADRARLIRIGAAQRRVAELVAKQWSVPVAAQAELEAALRVLAGHFQLHSDAQAGQAVASESRLRAQLSPQGDGLRLRLLVQPFGTHGPAVSPGMGRSRLLTIHQGLNLSTERRLDEETAHLDAVIEALPFLQDAQTDETTWLLADPEQALAAVERLPQLPAVAGVDWPRGKPVRVVPVATSALQASVKSGADWFALDGEVRIDEQRVLGLHRLLRLAHESRGSRFVALGDGEYLALTEQLRRQLADLHALAQSDAAGAGNANSVRLPAAAAAWLAETLNDTPLAGDAPWTRRLKLLDEAAALQPTVPAGLQADLRSYQVEGFAWMARLAHAGLGACLADDMGLGKTVQTLALLLHRAALGPALVIAPTSVCSNWVAEAQRFAPGLRVSLYGEGSFRAAQLQAAKAGDLMVASYALAQIDDEEFAKVAWATLVLDEAQALKNAATKRAKSVAQLQAGFRLALTGTPVENRLADLWSLMNLLNPGLLGSSGQFGERYTGPIERDRDPAAQARLRRLVSPFLLRRTKGQVMSDLPPRTEIIHRVEPGPEERAFLEASRRAALERVAELPADASGSNAFHVLTELTRLRRAACDPRLVAPELGIVGAKSHEFEQLAMELVAGKHKALVFSQFVDFLKLLAARLDAVGLKYQYLDGSTPAAERGKRVEAFQRGEGDLFLISLKAGGFGLNLTAADYVLIVDPWWNPAAEDQALGRAHRIGQLRPVTVYRLVTAGSVEERIIELHRDKRALADGILEGQDNTSPLGAQALTELLRGD